MGRSNINLVGNTTQGINLGNGAPVFKSKTLGNLMSYKTVLASGSSRIYETETDIIIWSNSGGTGVYNVTNGLTQFVDDIKLGGHLTENTEVSGGTTYSMTFDTNSMYMCSLPAKESETCVVYIGSDGKLATGLGGGGTGTITGGTNGLSTSGANITLGGVLTGDTDISGDDFNHSLSMSPLNFTVSGGSNVKLCTYFGSSTIGIVAESGVVDICGCNSNMIVGANGFAGNGIFGDAPIVEMSGGSRSIGMSNDGTFLRGLDAQTTETNAVFIDSDGKLASGATSGSGGFLGTVTKDTAEPSNLAQNQWVKPEPMSTDCFAYTFDNFADSGATAISVNLSLEDVYLRYCDSDYWIKESYDKPLSSGHTWIGSTTCKVCEIPVINEWVDSEAALIYTGQKYANPTQTISVSDVATCTITPNYVLTKCIPMCTAGLTTVFTIPTGCAALINSAKLIFLQTADPTSFCVSIGNDYCVTPSLGYQNLVSNVQIDDIQLNETYSLTPVQTGVPATSGIVYFNVTSATSCTLCAHLLIEGFIY